MGKEADTGRPNGGMPNGVVLAATAPLLGTFRGCDEAADTEGGLGTAGEANPVGTVGGLFLSDSSSEMSE